LQKSVATRLFRQPAGQILSQDARGPVLVLRERRGLLLEDYERNCRPSSNSSPSFGSGPKNLQGSFDSPHPLKPDHAEAIEAVLKVVKHLQGIPALKPVYPRARTWLERWALTKLCVVIFQPVP
jgi:hypothetical protein